MSWLAAAAEVGDAEGERTVVSIIALLAVIGIALVMLAIWMWRVTRPDPELLAPLELMGERSWRRRDPVSQRRTLDEVRPASADPLTRPKAPPDLDEAFHAGPKPFGVTDLRGLALDDAAESDVTGHAAGNESSTTGRDRPNDNEDLDAVDDSDGDVVDPELPADAPPESRAALDEEFDGGATPG